MVKFDADTYPDRHPRDAFPRGLRHESGARRERRTSSSSRHGHAPGGTRPEVMTRTTGDYSPCGLTQALLTGIFSVENTTELEPWIIPALLDYELMPSALNAPLGLLHPAEVSRTRAERGGVGRRREARPRARIAGERQGGRAGGRRRGTRQLRAAPGARSTYLPTEDHRRRPAKALVGTALRCGSDEHRGATPRGGATERGSLAMMGYRDIESPRGGGCVPASRRRPAPDARRPGRMGRPAIPDVRRRPRSSAERDGQPVVEEGRGGRGARRGADAEEVPPRR